MIEKIHPIPAFSDNYIWVFTDSDNSNACVVDPGDAAPVADYLAAHKLNLSDILITHHHPDHTGGVAKLVAEYQPRVFGPANSPFKAVTRGLQENDQIDVYGLTFQILEVPGHTLDHIAYYCNSGLAASQPILFCGDTMFAAGCGRIFEGDPPMMYHSLQKLAALDADSRVYCTHEYTLANLRFAAAADPDNRQLQERTAIAERDRQNNIPTVPSSLSLELATNPFLRCHEDALRTSAQSQCDSRLDNATEVFASLRQWKDNF